MTELWDKRRLTHGQSRHLPHPLPNNHPFHRKHGVSLHPSHSDLTTVSDTAEFTDTKHTGVYRIEIDTNV